MRKVIYKALIDRLAGIVGEDQLPLIKHVDLWNLNLEAAEEEVFDTPAVFVEFLPIEWELVKDVVRRGRIRIRLHIVTSAKGISSMGSNSIEASLNYFDVVDAINDALIGWNTADFAPLAGTESITNHDHGELIENIETYFTRVTETR